MITDFNRWLTYNGIDVIPHNATRIIVDDSVTSIKESAFCGSEIVAVILGKSVKRIEKMAFAYCSLLKVLHLSNVLEHIGESAFTHCVSLNAAFLPQTLKSIGKMVFYECESLTLLILPDEIDISKIGKWIITGTDVEKIVENAGEAYGATPFDGGFQVSDEDFSQTHNWLLHHMDRDPFHKLCYNSFVTTKQISDHINENGEDTARSVDSFHNMTPLHVLSMNPHASGETIATLLETNKGVAFCLDTQRNSPLDYAREHNAAGLVGMVNGLCIYERSEAAANSSIGVVPLPTSPAAKRTKTASTTTNISTIAAVPPVPQASPAGAPLESNSAFATATIAPIVATPSPSAPTNPAVTTRGGGVETHERQS